MALVLGEAEGSFGIAFLVAAGVVYEALAFACSSPQTAEINIQTRGDTLMKWVHLGQVLALILIVVAASVDEKHRVPIVVGGAFGMVSAELLYVYAKASGMKRPGPMTEQTYGARWPGVA